MLICSAVVFCMVLIGNCGAQAPCKATQWLKPDTCPEKTLPAADAYNVLNVGHKLKCMKDCNTTTGNCLSVSYDRRNKLCYHFDDIGDSCAAVVDEPDTQYYYRPIECFNGGTKISPTMCNCPVGAGGRNCNKLLAGCKELSGSGVSGTNRVSIRPSPDGPSLPIYCISSKTIVMAHKKFATYSFNRTWEEYVNGFMEDSDRIWIGLETLHQITKYSPDQVLHFRVNVVIGINHYQHNSLYDGFKVGDRSTNYRLTYSSYNPPGAINYLGDVLIGLNGSSFSTYDTDNDGDDSRNCALQYAGGWWFNGLNDCSRNSVTSFFTCPTSDCDPMATKQFPDRDKKFGIALIQLWMYTA